MNNFIKKLRWVCSVELGAYHAYGGHLANTSDYNDATQIVQIRIEEKIHRKRLELMLHELGSSKSIIYDCMFFIIGKLVSASCYIFPEWASARGASFMETIAIHDYYNLSMEAGKLNLGEYQAWLLEMEHHEKQHETFFLELYQELTNG